MISIGHHRGMDQITTEVLEQDFIECTEEHFNKMRERAKAKREEYGRTNNS